MTWPRSDLRHFRFRELIAASAVALAACGHAPVVSSPSSFVGGTLRVPEGQELTVSELGPVVVMLESTGSAPPPAHVPRLFTLRSSTDRFAPSFAALAVGDYLAFVNEGAVSHRLFSADLGDDVRIPVDPASSSEPVRIDRSGALTFFCSLHPDEHFGVLVTDGAFADVLAFDGRYHIGPVPEGTYRLSLWSPVLQGAIRTVTVGAGETLEETVWLDPDLLPR